jgi:hypothetical protein
MHSDSEVTALYVEPYVCNHNDGTGDTTETDLDFHGSLEGSVITGDTSTCLSGEDNPFGVGLRLSAAAAGELLEVAGIEELHQWLDAEGLYLFTINGFPYGSFHHSRVKDNVYAPDWGSKQRLSYTLDLVKILAELLPDGMDGGISTSPISYKYWNRDNKAEAELTGSACLHLAEVAWQMGLVKKQSGKELHLDIEPEPDCLIENSFETVRFFTEHLWPKGIEHLVEHKGSGRDEAEHLLKNHIRVCYDTCHFAVEFEEPADAVVRLSEAGIRIGKAQISAALKAVLGSSVEERQAFRGQLQEYVESTYLHQVVERRKDGSLRQYRDLPDALPHIADPDAEEWRIHFHVPIFTGQMGRLQSTRDHIVGGMRPLLEQSDCRHFEIETYTWEVLPDSLKVDIVDSIEREFRWFLELDR